MSSAFVPGRILRAAAWSRLLKNFCCSGDAGTGDSWSSAMGGGLGSRGDAGEAIAAMRERERQRTRDEGGQWCRGEGEGEGERRGSVGV